MWGSHKTDNHYIHNLFDRVVIMQVLTGHCRVEGLLAAYCDEAIYKTHNLYSENTRNPSLEIMAYYDDVEVCNPLGSRDKMHKLGMRIQDY